MKYFYVVMIPILRPYHPRSIPDSIDTIHATRKEARARLSRIGCHSAYIKRAYGDIEAINAFDNPYDINTWEKMVYEALARKKEE